MKPQIGGFLVLVLAQISFGLASESSNPLPWYPTNSAENNVNVKVSQTVDDDSQEQTYLNQGKY
jgi:hypothetical protein